MPIHTRIANRETIIIDKTESGPEGQFFKCILRIGVAVQIPASQRRSEAALRFLGNQLKFSKKRFFLSTILFQCETLCLFFKFIIGISVKREKIFLEISCFFFEKIRKILGERS